jgi:lysyl-tRNA synthetase class 2
MTDDASQFEPSASIEFLRARSHLLQHLRRWFVDQGFWECQTPVLSRERILDANIDLYTTSDASGRWFLQSSPEACMKRLLAAGADSIFQIGPAMRQSEQGQLHNAEFTIVEWYRVGDSYHDQMSFTEQLVRTVYAEGVKLHPNQKRMPTNAFERLTYDAAFEKHMGSRVLELDVSELLQLADQHGVSVPSTLRLDRDSLLNLLLAESVEPQLGQNYPEFLFDYPDTQAALARIETRDNEPNVALRFELYDRGIELCNGYQELIDADEFVERSRHESSRRQADASSSSADEIEDIDAPARLVAAMKSGLPECSGVALGLDRLVMLALGAKTISEVVAFPSRLA